MSTARIAPSKMLPSENRRAMCDVTFAAEPGFPDRGVSAPAFGQTSVKLCAACSRTASTCRRVTPGNHWRNCSTVAPSSRFSNRALTGTLVPLKVHAPLSLSEARSTPSHRAQSSMIKCNARRTGRTRAKRLRTHVRRRSARPGPVGKLLNEKTARGAPAESSTVGATKNGH